MFNIKFITSSGFIPCFTKLTFIFFKLLYLAPNIFIKDLITIWPQLDKLSPSLAERLEIESLYSGYVRRQKADVEAFRRDEHLSLPEHLNYSEIAGLSREVQDKLQASRPNTLGQAGRIPGVTPAALVTLLRFVRRAENSFERDVRSA